MSLEVAAWQGWFLRLSFKRVGSALEKNGKTPNINMTTEPDPGGPRFFPLHFSALASGVWDATGLLSSGNLLVIAPGPNPCGLGGDAGCSTADLDALYAVFGTSVPPNDALFDLNFDDVVDGADLNEWLSLATTENGHSSP